MKAYDLETIQIIQVLNNEEQRRQSVFLRKFQSTKYISCMEHT